jgi:hypothetical protein
MATRGRGLATISAGGFIRRHGASAPRTNGGSDLTPVPGPTGIAARAALEINGGRAEELEIAVGDRVQPIWAENWTGCEGS